MVDYGEIKYFLPRYLTPELERKLLEDLDAFPENIDKRMYSYFDRDSEVIYQGDGLNNLLLINMPDPVIQPGNALILSNTCDIDPTNERPFQSSIVYSPIFNFEKYIRIIRRQGIYEKERLDQHIRDIKGQRCTQIFFLPSYGDFPESIAFLDKVVSIGNHKYPRDKLSENRLFSLSQYGHYLFLYKLSIHFLRFNEKVNRTY